MVLTFGTYSNSQRRDAWGPSPNLYGIKRNSELFSTYYLLSNAEGHDVKELTLTCNRRIRLVLESTTRTIFEFEAGIDGYLLMSNYLHADKFGIGNLTRQNEFRYNEFLNELRVNIYDSESTGNSELVSTFVIKSDEIVNEFRFTISPNCFIVIGLESILFCGIDFMFKTLSDICYRGSYPESVS